MYTSAARVAIKISGHIDFREMKTTAQILVAFGLLCAGCDAHRHVATRTGFLVPLDRVIFASQITSVEEDVLAALLRFQVENRIPLDTPAYRFDYVFVSLGDEDPSARFLERFEAIDRTIIAASNAKSSATGVFHERDGRPGILFRYLRITWLSPTSVEVEAVKFVAGLSAALARYTLRIEKGEWKVIRERITHES